MQERMMLLYGDEGKGPKVQVLVQDETIWLTQKQIAELFEVQIPAVSKHLKNIFDEKELVKNEVVSKLEITTQHGAIQGKVQTREANFYNLDAIIAVGYRVNSKQATAFRIWATKVLKEYITKGFALDDARLKQAKTLTGKDYFRELLERVRSIRASERRIWLQVTEIFAVCSIDYDKNSIEARRFFASIQNLFHFAITGQTAAEIIYSRADRNKPNMGLTTWKESPDGRIYKSDIRVAKNYLEESQIRQLERAVNGFFDYIERQIELKQKLTMADMSEMVFKFLTFNDYKILQNKGTISRTQAFRKAYAEYDEFNKQQKLGTDFEEFVEELKKLKN